MKNPKKSRGEYPGGWSAIATRVKEKAGRKCARCGHPNDRESGHVLTVHHLDMDPSNNAWWNVVELCQRCQMDNSWKSRFTNKTAKLIPVIFWLLLILGTLAVGALATIGIVMIMRLLNIV